jgi:type IV pilus assembly protein PilQ
VPAGGAFDSNYLGTPEARAQENSEYITLAVKDRELTEVLRFIGRQVSVNIIPDPDVKEKVTVELDRVEWRKALDVIARLTHCKIVEEGERLIRFVQPPSISMEFQEADIKVVLELLAKQAGANILIASDVKGKVSLSLREVPWQEALNAVVKTAGYTTVRADTPTTEIIRVVRPDSLVEQLESRSFQLKYVRPKEPYRAKISGVEKEAESVNPFGGTAGDQEARVTGKAGAAEAEAFSLMTALQRALSKNGQLEYDSYTNTFIVKDTKPRLDEIESIIKLVDVQPPLIHVEVKFISTDNTDLVERGIRFDQPNTPETEGLILSARGEAPDAGATDPLFRFGGTFPFDIGRLDRIPQDFSALGILDFTQVRAVLRLIKEDTNSRLVQEPTLTMVNNQPATIFVGDEVPFAVQNVRQDQNGNVTASLDENKRSPINVGFILYLTPHYIPGTDMIDLSVIPKVSRLSGQTSPDIPGFDRFSFAQQGSQTASIIDLPRVASQTVVTYLRVQNGHTAVIGGLNTERRLERVAKVPLLSNIPILGNLFTWKRKENSIQSLIILITPHLLKSTEQTDRQFQKAQDRNKEKDYFYN